MRNIPLPSSGRDDAGEKQRDGGGGDRRQDEKREWGIEVVVVVFRLAVFFLPLSSFVKISTSLEL